MYILNIEETLCGFSWRQSVVCAGRRAGLGLDAMHREGPTDPTDPTESDDLPGSRHRLVMTLATNVWFPPFRRLANRVCTPITTDWNCSVDLGLVPPRRNRPPDRAGDDDPGRSADGAPYGWSGCARHSQPRPVEYTLRSESLDVWVIHQAG
jgi:hypothetical protein